MAPRTPVNSAITGRSELFNIVFIIYKVGVGGSGSGAADPFRRRTGVPSLGLRRPVGGTVALKFPRVDVRSRDVSEMARPPTSAAGDPLDGSEQ